MSRLLLIDDDAEFRHTLASALRDLGHTVVEAGRAADADAELARASVDLCVLDGLLPDATGLEWLARRRGADDKLRVAFVSAYWRDAASRSRLQHELWVDMIFVKPIDPLYLAHELDSTLASPSPSPVLRDHLPELRSRYAANLPGRIDAAEAAVDRAHALFGKAASAAVGSAVADAVHLAHRLRGTAGSYGFPAVSLAFGRLESLLRGLPVDAEPPSELWDAATTALKDARAAGPVPRPMGIDAARALGAHRGRVLLLDDDPDFLRLVAAIAARSAIEVIPATSEKDAIAICATLPVDGAIVDVNVEGRGTYPVVRKLRALPGRERLPVAFVSADNSVATRAAAAHAGAVRFLDKPVEPDLLVELANELVSLARRNHSRVLIVDDDPDYVQLASTLLGDAGIESISAGSVDAALNELDVRRPDLVLCDLYLPMGDDDVRAVGGLDLCRTMRLSPRYDDIPVVLVTARPDVASRLEAFRAGADDYVVKPVIPEELLARVRVRLDRAHLIRRAAEIDPTTGLMVRRAFARQLASALSEARRHGRPLSVALIDLDHFKGVNDTQGHLAGDRVLEGIGALMRRSFRVYDIVGRWGGEELVVAFPGEARQVAAVVTERLLAETRELAFEGDKGTFSVTFTAGVASSDEAPTLEALMTITDRRLYLGKRQGRARVVRDG